MIKLALPVLLTILLMTIIPTKAAIKVEAHYIAAQSNLKVLSNTNMIVFVPLANKTKNIPVAEATAGRTPKSSSMGLNTTPPPKPSIELRIPQTNPRISSLKVLKGVH